MATKQAVRVLALGGIALMLGAAGPGRAKGKEERPTGTVEGVVTYSGPLLDPIPISEAGTVRHPIVRDEPTQGLREAVVSIDGVPRSAAEPGPPQAEPAVLDQRNYEFLPHVLAVRAGRTVRFLNSDSPNHGVIAAALEPRNRFNVFTPPGGQYEHVFLASSHPIAIGCPIHAAMSAWIYVFDHPYFAVTDERGRFRLPALPPGEYTLQARHPDGGLMRKQRIVVRPGETTRITIAFQESDLKGKAGK